MISNNMSNMHISSTYLSLSAAGGDICFLWSLEDLLEEVTDSSSLSSSSKCTAASSRMSLPSGNAKWLLSVLLPLGDGCPRIRAEEDDCSASDEGFLVKR
jgi:hypothetical protein